MAFVLAMVRSFAMVDGTVAGICFSFLCVYFSVLVLMNCLMKTLERNNIQEISQQKQERGRASEPLICAVTFHEYKCEE